MQWKIRKRRNEFERADRGERAPLTSRFIQLRPYHWCRLIGATLLWGIFTKLASEGVASEEVFELQPHPVYAWHFDTLSLNFPGNVRAIDRSTIENSFATSLPELLSQEANLGFTSFNGSGAQGEVSMRGFGENSGLRVLVVVNGQRLNRPDLGTIEWQLLPLEAIESIEVIHGGQNVLYGNSALSGVILVTTRRGGVPRSSARGTTGSDGLAEGLLDHGGGEGKLFWDANFRWMEDGGYRENTRNWNKGLSASAGYRLGANGSGSIALNATLSEGFVQFPGPLLWEEFQANSRQSNNGGNESTEHLTGLVTLNWDQRHDWGASQMNASLHFRNLDWALDGIFAQNNQSTYTLAPRIRIGNREDFLMLGLDATQIKVDFDDFLESSRETRQAFAAIERTTLGPYLFAQKSLRPNFLLSAGIRYEQAAGDFAYTAFVDEQLRRELVTNRGTIPNPHYRNPPDVDPEKSYDQPLRKTGTAAELSLLWRRGSDLSLWCGYDRIYRYPVVDESAAYQGFELAEKLNHELDPETGHQVDIGLKIEKQSFHSSLTLFYLQLEGEIVYDNELNLNRNLADSSRAGAEGALGWYFARGSLSTRLSWVQAEFTSEPFAGQRVPLVPQWRGTTNAVWRPLSWLEMALHHTWVASSFQGNDFANELSKIASYHLLDLRLSAEYEGATLFLRVNNLFDNSYAPLAFRGGFYPAPGRQWRAGLRINF